jgi:hypothetical protein
MEAQELIEARRRGGLVSAERLTVEQRRARGRDAYLAGAVNTVIKRAADLTPEQRAAIVAALAVV